MALLAVFLLLLGGLPMAMGRAQPMPASAIAICGADGNEVLYLDASGQPLPGGGAPHHLCADCVPAMAPAGLAAPLRLPLGGGIAAPWPPVLIPVGAEPPPAQAPGASLCPLTAPTLTPNTRSGTDPCAFSCRPSPP